MAERRILVHCLTNPVTMQDTANILLAAGGSAIMAEEPEEAAEITALADALLLNTGVPDRRKFQACILSGKQANAMGIPIVLDPVGAGASRFRRGQLGDLFCAVRISLIRCNAEEALTLLNLRPERSCGVESSVSFDAAEQQDLAQLLSRRYGCAALVSGAADAVSDGCRTELLTGGDPRISRITGGGCMLSALCALLCAEGTAPYEAAVIAGRLWRKSACIAGERTDCCGGGMGSYHRFLFDAAGEIFTDRSC